MSRFTTGKLDRRLEAMVTGPLDEVITEVAKELAGTKNPRQFRSKAVRLLLTEAAEARENKKARAARGTRDKVGVEA